MLEQLGATFRNVTFEESGANFMRSRRARFRYLRARVQSAGRKSNRMAFDRFS